METPMSHCTDYAKKYRRPEDTNFALACYEQNTLEELEQAMHGQPDAQDIATWNLRNNGEWIDAVVSAWADKWEHAQNQKE
jgi:hypothetical protein